MLPLSSKKKFHMGLNLEKLRLKYKYLLFWLNGCREAWHIWLQTRQNGRASHSRLGYVRHDSFPSGPFCFSAVFWEEVSTAQRADVPWGLHVRTGTGLSHYFKEGYAAHRAQQVAQLSLGLQMIQPPLQITNLLAHCPRETYVPYPLPREPSSGLKWAWATMWTWTLLCRYKAMKVCLGPEDRPAMDAHWKNLTRLKTD